MSIEIAFEISGPLAMFTRPDSGSVPISYPLPTGSAMKGMVDSVAFVRGATFVPERVEVCAPLRFVRWATNYGGPLRKSESVKGNSNYQLFATVLADVTYRIHGVSELTGDHPEDGCEPRSKLAEMFSRRLASGQNRHAPCLGWKEFGPTYFGPLRAGSAAHPSVEATVEGYLISLWSETIPEIGRGAWAPSLRTVEIREGICRLRDGR